MISRATAYTARALGRAVRAKREVFGVKWMAREARVPPSYLAKLMPPLARAGLVRTRRGVSGGIRLAKPADRITLFDLCRALRDPCVRGGCVMGDRACASGCPCRRFWPAHHAQILKFLRSTTVADMGRKRRRRAAR